MTEQKQQPSTEKQEPPKKKGKKREITVEEAIQLTMERFKKDIEYLKDR